MAGGLNDKPEQEDFFTQVSNEDFVAYLKRMAIDLEESGSVATAADYWESAKRIEIADGL